ncbi:MAG: prolyl oligopeptidase family protein [Gemmatimonadales bacterium]
MMRSAARLFFLFVLLTIPRLGLDAQSPPAAKRGGHVDRLHDVSVPDPYRWLEDLESDATRTWARAQDAWTRDQLRSVPGRDWLERTIRRAAEARRTSTPVRLGGRYFYTTSGTTGAARLIDGVWMRTSVDGRPILVVDGDSIARAGGRVVLTAPSLDGRRMAFGVAAPGSRWMTIRIRDLDRGTDLSDTLAGLVSGRSSVSWRPDGAEIYYSRFEQPAGGDLRTAALGEERVFAHRLGDAQSSDRLVFAPPEGAGWALGTALTVDGATLVVTAKEPSSQGNRVYLVDPSGRREPSMLVSGFAETFTFVGSEGDEFWFQTDAAAPRGRVVAIDRRAPARERWRELIPERDETITNWLGVSAVGGHLAVGYLVDARHTVRVFATTGELRYELTLPRPMGSLWTGIVGRQNEPEAFYTLSGLADPGTVYRLDVATGRSTEFARTATGVDPDRFLTRQVFYRGKDGTRIPMFLVEGRDRPSGPAPVWMYGYGFDWAAAPWFQPAMVAWLELGGVFALPNTRGGTEYGEDWNAAGSRRHKQTAIDDYVAAAEHLIASGVTTRNLMVANASSAGGAIGGAALVQRPELFGAAVLDYPLLDMLRYDRFTGARTWAHEYGTVADPADFRALLAYSPYQTIRDGVCYPPTLVAPGELDQSTPPLHAYKFVAALQHAQSCDHPIALRVAWGAGHSAGATTRDATAMWVDQLAFLIRALDLGPPTGAGVGQGGGGRESQATPPSPASIRSR